MEQVAWDDDMHLGCNRPMWTTHAPKEPSSKGLRQHGPRSLSPISPFLLISFQSSYHGWEMFSSFVLCVSESSHQQALKMDARKWFHQCPMGQWECTRSMTCSNHYRVDGVPWERGHGLGIRLSLCQVQIQHSKALAVTLGYTKWFHRCPMVGMNKLGCER